MRLTLRTLLAYLDDTLSAAEVKKIGQKVAESDAAQELVARIKQVTRRRRLTTPPNGGKEETFDPNRVAEYLESELAKEEVTEIEKLCLESDVHLAEVAACHQILTLVESDLERPMLIPQAAKQRMYDLIHGRKQPRAVKPAPGSTRGRKVTREVEEPADETLLLGLPLFRQAPWLRWALPAAAALLLVTFGVIVWKVLSDTTPVNNPPPRLAQVPGTQPEKNDGTNNNTGGNNTKTGGNNTGGNNPKPGGNNTGGNNTKPGGNNTGGNNTNTGGNNTGGNNTKPGGNNTGGNNTNTGGNNNTGNNNTGGNKPNRGDEALLANLYDNDVPAAPSEKQTDVGTLSTPKQLLLHQPRGNPAWEQVTPKTKIQTGERLLSLPGYHSTIALDSGLELTLWGNAREFFPNPRVVESSATIYDNPAFHLEVGLHRGRILVKNERPDKAKFRLRFTRPSDEKDEVWDIVLSPQTEVGVELVSFYQTEQNALKQDTPQTFVAIYVLKGIIGMQNGEEIRGRIKEDYFRFWDNRRGILSQPELDRRLGKEHWSKEPVDKELAKKLDAALDQLQLKVTGKGLALGLEESRNSMNPIQRLLVIRALGAMGKVTSVLEIIDEDDEDGKSRSRERTEAIITLRHWLSRGKGQYDRLFNEETSSGLLIDNKKYTPGDARIILALLRPFTIEQIRQPETYQLLIRFLTDKHLIIRELAYFQLRAIVPGEKTGYNPAGTPEARTQGQENWTKLIPPGKLPPVPMNGNN